MRRTLLAVIAAAFLAGFFKALAARNTPAPQVLWLVDPNDYLRPLVFDLRGF
ncbi:MAG TPA: hypothetical protein VKW06_09130 [Candidatus Angelobacter sp.]|nr:hypothetical protein [Candidatus Angelobacter sp.]